MKGNHHKKRLKDRKQYINFRNHIRNLHRKISYRGGSKYCTKFTNMALYVAKSLIKQ